MGGLHVASGPIYMLVMMEPSTHLALQRTVVLHHSSSFASPPSFFRLVSYLSFEPSQVDHWFISFTNFQVVVMGEKLELTIWHQFATIFLTIPYMMVFLWEVQPQLLTCFAFSHFRVRVWETFQLALCRTVRLLLGLCVLGKLYTLLSTG